jgi:uncharacterized protein YndB with AHSA1/START domain
MTALPGRSVLVVKRVFAARPARLFAAWSSPELMAQWFFPAPGWRADVVADVRVGGRYRVAMHDPAGGVHVQEGTYVSIVPAASLVFTWTCLELGVSDSLVTLALRDVGGKTELTLSHELPDDAAILREHEGGWNGCLDSLARSFETDSKEDPS